MKMFLIDIESVTFKKMKKNAIDTEEMMRRLNTKVHIIHLQILGRTR